MGQPWEPQALRQAQRWVVWLNREASWRIDLGGFGQQSRDEDRTAPNTTRGMAEHEKRRRAAGAAEEAGPGLGGTSWGSGSRTARPHGPGAAPGRQGYPWDDRLGPGRVDAL